MSNKKLNNNDNNTKLALLALAECRARDIVAYLPTLSKDVVQMPRPRIEEIYHALEFVFHELADSHDERLDTGLSE